MTDPIKAKIIELCPDVMERVVCPHDANCKETTRKNITLAVVLRAIKIAQNYPVSIDTYGLFYKYTNGNAWRGQKVFWNLEQDNYDQQSEECKQFIGSLLGV